MYSVRTGESMRRMLSMPREIYALLFVRFVVSAGNFVSPFLAMMLTMRLGYTEAAAGVFMSAVAVVGAIGLMIGGRLGDTLGRRKTLIALQALTGVAYLACAAIGLSPALPILIAFAMGTLSGTWPVINAVVADVAGPDIRKDAFSLLYWGNNIGFSIGPLIAGYLFMADNSILFVGNALAIFAAAAAVFLFVRETLPSRLPGQPAEGERNVPTPARESTLAILRQEPVLAIYGLICVLSAFVYNQHTFALPLFLKDLLGSEAGPKGFGAAMTVNGLTVVVCTIAVTALTKKFSALACITVSSAIYVIGFGSYAFANGLPFVLFSTFFWTIGEILGATSGNAFVAERAAPSHRSRINSAISLCYVAGGAVAPLVAGFLAGALGTRAIWYPVAGVAALMTVAYLLLERFDKKRTSPKAERFPGTEKSAACD